MSNSVPGRFSPKKPGERVWLSFNFAKLTSTPANPSWTITQVDGPADSQVANMRSGSPQLAGPRSAQLVVDGVEGADYLVECAVDDGAQRWILSGILSVRA